MHTQERAGAQQKTYKIIAKDPVDDLIKATADFAGKLEFDGLHIPEAFTVGENGPIFILEDRDRNTNVGRGRRFDKADMVLAFSHARSVLIVPYCPRKNAPRVGLVGADGQALTLHSRLIEGGVVLVLTTSDRLRHWCTEARTCCPAGTVIEFFDAKGVAKVVEGGV